ncbi:MAG TPA: glycosyltransferase 87 family protein [Candidatus Obscuribacterales bacterium]
MLTFTSRWYREILLVVLISWLIGHLTITEIHAVGTDFQVFYDAAVRLQTGKPLYADGEKYIYPPLCALLVVPLLSLHNPLCAMKAWAVFETGCLCLGAWLTASCLPRRFLITGFCVSLLLFCRNGHADCELMMGNCNFVLLLCVASLIYATFRRSDRAFIFSVIMGTLFKQWFVVFSVVFLLQKKYRQFFSCAVLSCAALAASFLVLKDWRQIACLLKWMNAYCSRKWIADLPLQSFYGFADLHFRQNQIVHPWICSPPIFWLVWLGGVAVVIAGLIWVFRTKYCSDDVLPVCIFTVSIMLVMTISHGGYVCICLPVLSYFLLSPAKFPAHARLMAVFLYLAISRGYGAVDPARVHGLWIESIVVSSTFYWFFSLWATGMWIAYQTHHAASRGIRESVDMNKLVPATHG